MKTHLLFRHFMSAAVLALSLVGCQSPTPKLESGKVRIVATTGMVGDMIRNVGGDAVKVVDLMGPGTDPHLYKASPGDISKIESADGVVYHGLHLEGKMGDVFERVGRRKPTLALAEKLPTERLLNWSAYAGSHDPHVWFDVELWSGTASHAASFLSLLIPDRASQFESNARAYREKLLRLHEECRAQIGSIPKERRVLITAHDAFGYFGRAYGVEVMGVQGISTESEASLKEINRLVDVMVERGVPAVFVETSVSTKNVQALLEGARSRGLNARIGGSLYSDAMGAMGTPDGSYEGMVRANVRAIVSALNP